MLSVLLSCLIKHAFKNALFIIILFPIFRIIKIIQFIIAMNVIKTVKNVSEPRTINA